MPRVPDASSVTRFHRINAQSLATPYKPSASSVPAATLVSNGTVGATVKASTVAVAIAPKTAIVTTSNTKVNTKKRG